MGREGLREEVWEGGLREEVREGLNDEWEYRNGRLLFKQVNIIMFQYVHLVCSSRSSSFLLTPLPHLSPSLSPITPPTPSPLSPSHPPTLSSPLPPTHFPPLSSQAAPAFCLGLTEQYLLCGCAGGVVRVFDPFTLDYVSTLPKPHSLGINVAAANPR